MAGTDLDHAAEHRPHRGAGERPWVRRGLIGLVALLVLGLVAQPVRLRAVAAATVADGLDLPLPRPFAAQVVHQETEVAGITVDVYGPGDADTGDPRGSQADGRVVLLVPGATPSGRADRRVVQLAGAFARSQRTVVVPELEVYGEDLVPADIERIVALTSSLAASHGPVVLCGISFGGSLSLVAAADPRVDGDIATVATFGSYADLAGVIQAATTGVGVVDGEPIPWSPDPRAADVVRDQLVGLLPSEARAALLAALEGRRDPAELPEALRAAYDLLTNDDSARTFGLIDALPAPARDRLEQVSPARAAPDLQVPILALHARDDPVLPYAELHRLGEVYPQAELLSLTTFDHVGLDPDAEVAWWVTARDLWTTTRFVTRVLDVQRHGASGR